MSYLRQIGIAIDEYHENYKSYRVASQTTLSGIQTERARAHIYNVPLRDSWGGEFLYMSDGKDFYTILSMGKDRKRDEQPQLRGCDHGIQQRYRVQ